MPVPAGGNSAQEAGRLIGPDEAYRVVFLRDGRARARGYPVPLFADEAASIPADVLTLTGEDIPESTVIVDVHSRIPLFQYPPGSDVVYTSINGGPIVPLYARVDDRIDKLGELVGNVGDLVDNAVAAEAANRAAAISAEQNARVAADTALSNRLNVVESAAEDMAGDLADLGAQVARKKDVLPPIVYLDAYNTLFGGVTYQTGQRTTATTLSAAADAGATSVTVASATAIVTGMLMVVGAGTPAQQILTVTNVSGSTLTVSPPLAQAWANGSTIAPVWLNNSHITPDGVGGSRAYGYWLANARRPDGSYVFDGPPGQTIVWLGDSWTAESIIEFNAELDARLGPTEVVNAGIPGNKLGQMIARFPVDVAPHSPDVVVLEYGVNDIYALLSSNTMIAELQQAVTMCQAIGARVVIPGIVPLIDHPAASEDRNIELKALVSSPEFPLLSAAGLLPRLESVQTPRNASSLRFGSALTQPLATGLNNVAIGPGTQQALTTGASNTAVGVQVQNKIVSANYNTGVGQGAQFSATTSFNTAVGALGQFGLTTGLGNTAIGYGSQYAPAGVTANATSTASYQTCIGYQSGQAGASQDDRITTIGYWAVASGASATSIGAQAAANGMYATAIGSSTQASAAGAVAIGRDSSGTGAAASGPNDFVLGTLNHRVIIPGTLRLPAATTTRAAMNIAAGVAPANPADGDVWMTAAGMFYRAGGVTVGPLT